MNAPALARKLAPTGFKPAYLRECVDVLSDAPPLLRWRARPRPHFPPGEEGDRPFKIWGNTFAGQTIRPQADGRLRLSLTDANGVRQKLDARAIIAEIGITPCGPDGPTGP